MTEATDKKKRERETANESEVSNKGLERTGVAPKDAHTPLKIDFNQRRTSEHWPGNADLCDVFTILCQAVAEVDKLRSKAQQ